ETGLEQGHHRRMILCRRWLLLPLAAAFGLAADVRAQFGLHEDDRFYTIDCESQPSLRVKVSKANGNLQSIVVDGTELQRNPRGSHLNSGFGNGSKVAAKTFGDDRILITIESQLGPLHYY